MTISRHPIDEESHNNYKRTNVVDLIFQQKLEKQKDFKKKLVIGAIGGFAIVSAFFIISL